MGKHKVFNSTYMLLYGLFFKMIGDGIMTTIGPNDLSRALGAGFLSMVGVGWLTVSSIVVVQLCCADVHIGLTTLLTGSTRSIGGSVAVVIYTTVLHNVLGNNAGQRIAKAVVPLGAPLQSLPALTAVLISGKTKDVLDIPGVTPTVLQAARDAIEYSWAQGFK